MQSHPKHPWHRVSQASPKRSGPAHGRTLRPGSMATEFQLVMLGVCAARAVAAMALGHAGRRGSLDLLRLYGGMWIN